ncbi:MAG: hypothetical protein ACYCZH_01610 [Sulfuriferula sp.]
MKKSPKIFAGFVLSMGLLLAVPSAALAHNDESSPGISFSFGVPDYERSAPVYAPPRQAYVYTQRRAEYYQHRHDNQDNRSYGEDHRRWRDHHHEYRHHDDRGD